MDFQTIKSQEGAGWAWARTGALILFLVTGILLVATLTSAHSMPSPMFADGFAHARAAAG